MSKLTAEPIVEMKFFRERVRQFFPVAFEDVRKSWKRRSVSFRPFCLAVQLYLLISKPNSLRNCSRLFRKRFRLAVWVSGFLAGIGSRSHSRIVVSVRADRFSIFAKRVGIWVRTWKCNLEFWAAAVCGLNGASALKNIFFEKMILKFKRCTFFIEMILQ